VVSSSATAVHSDFRLWVTSCTDDCRLVPGVVFISTCAMCDSVHLYYIVGKIVLSFVTSRRYLVTISLNALVTMVVMREVSFSLIFSSNGSNN
jgi:hypothetical protein